MMKSLLAANRSEKDSFRIPHSVQQSIPIRRIYTDGIWQVGQKYSKTWRFSDINYAASSLDDRRSIFRSYGAVLNSLPTDATAKITIINRRLNPVDFQRTMLMPESGDGLDYYRGESNQIILDHLDRMKCQWICKIAVCCRYISLDCMCQCIHSCISNLFLRKSCYQFRINDCNIWCDIKVCQRIFDSCIVICDYGECCYFCCSS